MRADLNIPQKANRVLNLILLAFMLILIRVWYLSFVQHDEHLQKARRPQRKTMIERVERATIRDRFNIPLAQNKIQYNAAVRYADLREIPSYIWKKDENGKKIREPVRSVYIQNLSQILAHELQMDPQAIEDIIYAKATLFPHTPFILKEHLSEKEYYRLRMLEKDWPGLEAQKTSRRIYPQGKIGCDIVGYMGAINQKEYFQIAQEIKLLQEYIQKREAGEIVFLPAGYNDPIEVRKRLKELQEKAYTINDFVGKSGIEAVYDETLRGYHGKKMFEIDPKGNILRELPGTKKGLSGHRVFLSISSELQEFAEQLLAHNETVRDVKDKEGNKVPGKPWIKGGAIVALDPKTGDVLALASCPRFDPNDFISTQDPLKKKKQQEAVTKWIENETYIGSIWDGKQPMERECFSLKESNWYEETFPLTWDEYLTTILPPDSHALAAMKKISNLYNAYYLQKNLEDLMLLTAQTDITAMLQAIYSGGHHVPCKKRISEEQMHLIDSKLLEHREEIQKNLEFLHYFLSSVPYNDDKLLILDLCRIMVHTDLFDPSLISLVGPSSLSFFHLLSQSLKIMHDEIKEEMQKLHHCQDFKEWRQAHFKEFLKQKRKEEKTLKKYALPYSEYLEKVERTLFKEFWQVCKYLFLDAFIHGEVRISVKDYPQLEPYLQKLIALRTQNKFLASHANRIKDALAPLSAIDSVKYLKTMRSFEELNRPLYGKYRYLRNTKGIQLEKHLAGAFYPLSGFSYVRSQAFRQSTPAGSVFKLVIAYEALKERYEYLLEHQLNLNQLNPLTIIDLIQWDSKPGSTRQTLGYTLDGQPIKRLYKGGILPRTHPNIGKIDLIGAIEQSSNIYFSLLAAEHVADTSFLEEATRNMGYGAKTGINLGGEIGGSIPDDLAENKTGLYSFAIGQHALIVTPLQTAVMLSAIANEGKILKPKIVHLTAGKQSSDDPFSSIHDSSFAFQEQLSLIGVDFPLFTETLLARSKPAVHQPPTEIKKTLFLPSEIRTMLLEGMRRVINGPKGTARGNIIRYLIGNPKAAKDYYDLKHQLVGKTGTAEILYKQWVDAESKAIINNHIWFAGIAFSEDEDSKVDEWGDPELVVVVFLRFSQAGGKEAAPLAAQIVQKWREIQKKQGKNSYIIPSNTNEKATAQNTEW
jgi:cell division protein FtsI/penicillin-binding protein 2